MNDLLADLTPGFGDATHGAQQAFRCLLDAMSRPGRVRILPAAATAGIVPPSDRLGEPMGIGATAVLLTLLDAETSLCLWGRSAGEAAIAYLRFHTGIRMSPIGDDPAYTLAHASEVDVDLWTRLGLGRDEAPQDGATLIVEVDELEGDSGCTGSETLQLRGPGIESQQTLYVSGLSRAFWSWRTSLQSSMPRGIDLVLLCGARLAAVPRSTRITLEG